MCCLALVTIDRWQNSISGTRRRIVMSCGKVVLPLLHTTVPLSSPVDKRELRLQRFWGGSLLAECGWRVVLSFSCKSYFTMVDATIFLACSLFFTKETMSLNTMSSSTYAAINIECRVISHHLHFLSSNYIDFHLSILKCIF